MSQYQNIGLLFNKHYFKNIKFEEIDFKNNTSYKPNENELIKQNKILQNSLLEKNNIPKIEVADLSFQTFKLQTTYPGLFTGSGLAHESSVTGELKLGFYFDYTSGLPCIPGSSVKGVLRSAFEKADGGYVKHLLEKELKIKIDFKIEDLKNEIFEDNEKSIYQRDIFFDAFPVSIQNKFLGDDYITPHSDPLKNPVPLPFLKVMPQVEFEFRFDLKDGTITADQKIELFRQILLDLGVGAKTNVGYGQFEISKVEQDIIKKAETERKRLLEIENQNKVLDEIKQKEANKTKAEKTIIKGAKLECKVVEIKGKKKKTIICFEWDNELTFEKKQSKINTELKVGDIVEIEIEDDFYLRKEVIFSNKIVKKD